MVSRSKCSESAEAGLEAKKRTNIIKKCMMPEKSLVWPITRVHIPNILGAAVPFYFYKLKHVVEN